MIKKAGAFVFIFLILFSLIALSIADEINDSDINDSETSSTITTTTTATTPQQNTSKIDKAYTCLKDKVKNKCSSLSVEEIALTILSTPDSDILTECKTALNSKKGQNCWPSGSCTIKDTALALLALNHGNEDAPEVEQWLLSKSITPTDIIWYLEQDSNEASQCKISYDSNDYTINVADNKKIDSSAGPCLSLAVSNYWLQVSPECYNKQFIVSCDKDFISTLLYKSQNSPTLYVSSDTKSAPGFGSVDLTINAKCFSTSSQCDYEGSLWATLALIKTRNNVDSFIPYLIASEDSNKGFLPSSFIYMITNNEDYGNQLIQEQSLGNYWEADMTPNNKFYDTALALIALKQSSSEKVIKARDWALFSQSNDGCWKISDSEIVRDTAIMLWALTSRTPSSSGGSSVTLCGEADYFCIPRADCPTEEDVGDNYFCDGLSNTCCINENLKNCEDYTDGKVCESGEACTNERKALDTDTCCVGECEIPSQGAECEEMGLICLDSCSSSQEEIDYNCDSEKVCCRTKQSPAGTRWWIWLLIIGIILVLGIIGYLLRDKLRLFFFKLKSKFKKDKGSSQSTTMPSSPFPPRPGFPPMRRMPPIRPMPFRRPSENEPKDKTMDSIFKKLKDMSK